MSFITTPILPPTPTYLPVIRPAGDTTCPNVSSTNQASEAPTPEWPGPIPFFHSVCSVANTSYTWPCCQELRGDAALDCGWTVCLTNATMQAFEDCVDDIRMAVGEKATHINTTCVYGPVGEPQSGGGGRLVPLLLFVAVAGGMVVATA